MDNQYILSVDQSTQGTKALLFDHEGSMIGRADKAHAQIISDQGWVSHDLDEIYENTLQVIREVVEKTGISKEEIAGFGISNQRETTAIWEKDTGKSVADAIVWQCSRAKEICSEIEKSGKADFVSSIQESCYLHIFQHPSWHGFYKIYRRRRNCMPKKN